MHPALYNSLFLPVYSTLKADGSLGALKRLCRHDDMSAVEFRAIGEKKLLALMRHTVENVPYYRALFRERALDAEDFGSFNLLSRLPIVTKSTIRSAGDAFFAEDVPREGLIQDATGGSSGTPFVFYYRRRDRDILNGNLWRVNAWMGATAGTRIARIWGCDPISRSRRIASRYLNNTITMVGNDLSDDAVVRFVDEMHRCRPTVIEAYGHLLFEFCQSLQNLDLHPPSGIKAAIFGAEGLGAPQRSFIENILGCPVRERYGSREFLAIAGECEEGSLHITSDVNWIEVVDDDGNALPPGNLGQIVVTCLHSYAFPLIRYAIGDVGVMDPKSCSCGRPHPVLAEVGGRASGVLHLPDGTCLTGLAIAHRMRMLDRIGKVQLVQVALSEVTVLVRQEDDSRDRDIVSLLNLLLELTRDEITFTVERVAEIPRTASGKYELVRSQL